MPTRKHRTDTKSNRCIIAVEGWITPRTLYDLDGDKNVVSKSAFSTDVAYPGYDQLVTEEVEVKGHDGTMIPLSLIFRKGTKLDGSHPTLLSGYGAYSITIDPYFTPLWIAWIEQGGVIAFAHVRGGGE